MLALGKQAQGWQHLSEEDRKVLRRLYASRSSLTTLPSDVFDGLPKLAELDLSGNHLTHLPKGIGQMQALRKCYLHNNSLRELPPDITCGGSCPDLRELWLDHNELTTLPSDWSGPRRMVTLQLGWNHLSQLPDGIGNLCMLRQLLVQQNELQSLPDTLCGLKQLSCIALRANQLAALPASIGQLSCLNRVLLGVNPIGSSPSCGLPASFCQCPMVELYLSACQLKAVPEALQGFAKTLRWIDISDNEITMLPSWMSTLKAMKWLDCEDNDIQEFPKDVLHWLSNLNGVGLCGNPLLAPLQGLVDLDAKDVPEHIRTHAKPSTDGMWSLRNLALMSLLQARG
jgi:leucine-rich repeat protein SHOC2